MNDETWYVVRNTRGVTSFVGPGSKPVPLTEEELHTMGLISAETVNFDFEVGEVVRIMAGSFEDSTGSIQEVNHQRQTVTVALSIFGRETPVELEFTEIERL
jgi:transcriptional antiterminator NusG